MTDPTKPAVASEADQERAKWAALNAQIDLTRKQARWETPKALAMILLAVAAVAAAGRLTDLVYPPRPQTIIIQFAQPLPFGKP
jgi:hypothetical protein